MFVYSITIYHSFPLVNTNCGYFSQMLFYQQYLVVPCSTNHNFKTEYPLRSLLLPYLFQNLINCPFRLIPQILRIFTLNGFFLLHILASQKAFVLTPFFMTYPFLSILISLSECHSPSDTVQSRLKNSISSTPSSLV